MPSHTPTVGLALALLAGAASNAAPPLTGPARTNEPAAVAPDKGATTTPLSPASRAAGAAPPREVGEDPGRSEAPKRLGRRYPAPVPEPYWRPGPRETPRVYVSVVSPRDSGVHQHQHGRRQHFAGTGVDGAQQPAPEPDMGSGAR
jgi:hypothetical protein